MNKEQIWNILLVISIILIIHGMTKTGSIDKKEAQAGTDEATIGAVGAVGSFIMKKRIWGIGAAMAPWFVAGISALLLLIPNFLGNMINLFRPQPTIPIWIWGAGIIVLLFMVLRKK